MLIGPTPGGGGAGPVLSHHVEYVRLNHDLVSPYRELPKKHHARFRIKPRVACGFLVRDDGGEGTTHSFLRSLHV